MTQPISAIGVAARLEEFLGQRMARHLKDVRKRGSFALYAQGMLGDGERKSMEPIAARACAEPEQVNNLHSKLGYFIGRSVWDDQAVRLEAARYAIEAVEQFEPVTAWIIDDTGFLKQGKHSVGVGRQYTGSAGKVTNCQIGVSLAVATRAEQIGVDFELYLPKEWAEDPELRAQARIPEEVTFKTKPELALDMIKRAARAKLPGDIILADSAFGNNCEFRNTLQLLGFDYGVGIQSTTRVIELDRLGRERGEPMSASELVSKLGRKGFRKLTWREGSQGKLSSRFCFRQVKTVHEDGLPLSEREPQWLVAEWPEGDDKPSRFILTTLPKRMSHKELVRLFKERWRTERMYQDLKGQLGLEHFEGRSFPGWHHHISVVLCCYAFVVAERSRALFPPEKRKSKSRQNALAA